MNIELTLMLSDIVATIAVFSVAIGLRLLFLDGLDIDLFSHFALLPLLLIGLLYFLTYFKAYGSPIRTTMAAFLWAIFKSIVLSVGLVMTITFIVQYQHISRFVIGIFAGLDLVFLIGIRVFIKKNIQKKKNQRYVLIIGTGNRAKQIYRELRNNSEYELNIIGCLDIDAQKIGGKVRDSYVIGTVDEIHKILKNNIVDEVIIAVPRSIYKEVENIVFACEEEGIRLSIMADIYDFKSRYISLESIGSVFLLRVEPVALDEVGLVFKRIFDFTMVCACLPFLILVVAIIAIAIKFDSPGPIFYLQDRVGFRKRNFKMIKLRSMVNDAEKMIGEIEHLNEADGPNFKISNDPRVTRVGKFLRKFSIDELPQLLNVLKGEMSLVGPRPMSLRDVNLFDKGIQRKRFSVKPGLTCLWQISGRSNLGFSKWLELDLKYIENWSMTLDFVILFKTIPAVIRGKGAV